MDKMESGHWIRSIRRDKGLTLEEFGRTFDPPAGKSAVSKWERGITSPNPKRIKRLKEMGAENNSEWNELIQEFKQQGLSVDDVRKSLEGR